jgi:hypothetical protein
MQKKIKTFQPFRLLTIIFLAASLMTACKNKESKTTEVQSSKEKKDTLPALDKNDTLSTTRPETIKN